MEFNNERIDSIYNSQDKTTDNSELVLLCDEKIKQLAGLEIESMQETEEEQTETEEPQPQEPEDEPKEEPKVDEG